MKLYYIGIIKNESKPGHELCVEKNLTDYSRFTRNNYGEFMSLFSKTVAERTTPGSRLAVKEQDYTFHALGRTEGICAIMITDQTYSSLNAQSVLGIVVDDFLTKHPRSSWSSSNPTLSYPELKGYLEKYQKVEEVDKLAQVQKNLDDTKKVMFKTIESLLERGEKIDDLVHKSDSLSAQSKMFYTQAKKQNSCCVIM